MSVGAEKRSTFSKISWLKPVLRPEQIQFMLPLLNRREPDQKEIAQQLQKQMGVSYTGSLRAAQPNERVPVSWLEIGELTPPKMGSSDNPDPVLRFWLQHLCYDPLLVYRPKRSNRRTPRNRLRGSERKFAVGS